MTASTATAVRIEASPDEPWLGLRSFHEADARRFFGREDEEEELLRLVRRSRLSVLFGLSGLGKTSLLQAGLFPKARAEHLLPIPVRFDFAVESPTLCGQIRAAVAREIDRHGVDGPKPTDGESLPLYFRRARLWSKRNKLLVPLLVLDQFEEMFTLALDHPGKRRDELLDELADLFTACPSPLEDVDELEVPAIRMIIALREDFLAQLEDLRARLPAVTKNTFRLRRMDGIQALRAVREPGANIVTSSISEKIVRFTAGAVDKDARKSLEDLRIEPVLLSLVCCELDKTRRDRKQDRIEESQIVGDASRVIDKFYDESFVGLDPRARRFVEDWLLTPDGYRTTCAIEVAQDETGVTAATIEALVDRRLLNREELFGRPHVEIIHDVLARVVDASRKKRYQRRRSLGRALWILAGVALAGVAVGGGLFWSISHNARVHADQQKNLEVGTMLSREGRKAALSDNNETAIHLLESARENLGRAGTIGAQELRNANLVLFRTLRALGAEQRIIEPPGGIDAVSLSPDGWRVVTVGHDQNVLLWDVATGRSYPVASGSDKGDLRPLAGTDVVDTLISGAQDAMVTIAADGGARAVALSSRLLVEKPHEFPLFPAPTSRTTGRWRACIAPDDSIMATWLDGRLGQVAWDLHLDGSPGQPVRIDEEVLKGALPEVLKGALPGERNDDIVCLPHGRLLIVNPFEVSLWDPKDGNKYAVSERNPYHLEAAAGVIVTMSRPGEPVAIMHIPSQVRERLLVPGALRSIALSSDGRHLLTIAGETPAPGEDTWSDSRPPAESSKCHVAVWELGDGKSVSEPHLVFAIDRVNAQARWSPDDRWFVVSSDRGLEAWDRVGFTKHAEVRFKRPASSDLLAVATHGKDLLRVLVGDGNRARVVDLGGPAESSLADGSLSTPPEAIGAWYAVEWPRVADVDVSWSKRAWTALLGSDLLVGSLRGSAAALYSVPGGGGDVRLSPSGRFVCFLAHGMKDFISVFDTVTSVVIRPPKVPTTAAWVGSGDDLMWIEKQQVCRWAASAPRARSCAPVPGLASPINFIDSESIGERQLVLTDSVATVVTDLAGRVLWKLPHRLIEARFWKDKYLAVLEQDHSVAVFEVAGGKELARAQEPEVSDISWTTDGRLVRQRDGELEVGDLGGPTTKIQRARTPPFVVTDQVAWVEPRSSPVAWDVSSGAPRARANLHDDWLAEADDSGRYARTSRGVIYLPPLDRGPTTRHGSPIRSVAVDGALGYVLSDDPLQAYLWKNLRGDQPRPLARSAWTAASPGFPAVGGSFAQPMGNHVDAFDLLQPDRRLAHLELPGEVTHWAWDARGTLLAAVDDGLRLGLVEVGQAPPRDSTRVHELERSGAGGAGFGYYGNYFLRVEQGVLEVWDARRDKRTEVLPVGKTKLERVAIAGRSDVVVVATLAEHQIQLYSTIGDKASSGLQVVVLDQDRFPGRFTDLLLTPDGRYLVGLDGSTATVWDTYLGTQTLKVPARIADVDEQGRFLLTAMRDGTRNVEVRRLNGDGVLVNSQKNTERLGGRFVPGGNYILLDDGTLLKVDGDEIEAGSAEERVLGVSGDGSWALLRKGNACRFLDLASKESPKRSRDAAPCPDALQGAEIVGGHHDKVVLSKQTDTATVVQVWDVDRPFQPMVEVKVPGAQQVRLTGTGLVIALAGNGVLTGWDLATGKRLWTHDRWRVEDVGAAERSAWSVVTDGSQLVVSRLDLDGPQRPPLTLPTTSPVLRARLDVERKRLYAVLENGSIVSWGLEDGPIPTVLRDGANSGDRGVPTILLVSPDGRWLAVGHEGGTLELFGVEGERRRHPLVGHLGAIRAAAFDESSTWLATGSEDGTVRLWDVRDAECLLKLTRWPGASAVTAVAWSKDAGQLLAGDADGGVFTWTLEGEAPSNAVIDRILERKIPPEEPETDAVRLGSEQRDRLEQPYQRQLLRPPPVSIQR
jgi:WD40 repeat protein